MGEDIHASTGSPGSYVNWSYRTWWGLQLGPERQPLHIVR